MPRMLFALLLVTVAQGCSANRQEPEMNSAQMSTQNTMTVTTYLLLDGNCKDAMQFYGRVFRGALTLSEIGESPMKNHFPEIMHQRILNARLVAPGIDLSASDWLRPDQAPSMGNRVCLYISGGTYEETKRIFDELSDGAEVTDPMDVKPYGVYGALNDRFGVRWMFHAAPR